MQNVNISPQTDHIMFLDVETVPNTAQYSELSPEARQLWSDKSRQFRQNENDNPETLYERAGIYAEFGKIICISVGYLQDLNGERRFYLRSYAGDDEKLVLQEFVNMLTNWDKAGRYLCGHNIREFDVPYLCRRLLIHGIMLPPMLDIGGLKPWEVRHLDTLQLWKFGDYKHYTSLKLLAWCFGIPSPKNDIDGSEVARVYYEEHDLARIVAYCERDVVTVARLYLKLVQGGEIEEQALVVRK
jgi:predicted PolB exonuclease-like 3'-5' exonuclease